MCPPSFACCAVACSPHRWSRDGSRTGLAGRPLLLSGGRLKMGQVIGQSTRDVAEPLSEPVKVSNLVATVLHTLLELRKNKMLARGTRSVS